MKVKSHTIQQLKPGPKSRCRDWRFWASTDCGRKSHRFHGTWTDAQNAIKGWVAELEQQVPDSESFASYAASWALWRASMGRYSPNTIKEDKRKVAALCRTELSGMRIAGITPDDCRSALLWLRSNPTKGGAYTNTTMGKFHQTLDAIMQQAEDDGLVARNPMARIKPPKPDTRERDALSPEELQLFLNRVDGLPLDGRSMALYLMACLGLRRAEACALLDSDVHGGIAYVHQSVKERDGSVGAPKSEAGIRSLPIPARLQERIGLWRECRRALGLESAPTLACNTLGGIILPQNLWRWWKGIAPSLGCEGMTLHDLRHSNLSMVARHMSAFDLQRYAGWSSIAPARIYIHDDMESVARAVESAWSAFGCTESAPA